MVLLNDKLLWHLVAFYVSEVLILPPCLHEEFLSSSD